MSPRLGRVLFILFTLWFAGSAAAQEIRRLPSKSKYDFVFRPVQLPGRSYPVSIEIHAAHYKSDTFVRPMYANIRFSCVQLSQGKRVVLSHGLLDDGAYLWLQARLYRDRKSEDILLVEEINAGQYDHTMVYRLDPKRLTLVATTPHGVLQGDTTMLPRGVLIENTYEHYVRYPAESHRSVRRIWNYRLKSHSFKPGRLVWGR